MNTPDARLVRRVVAPAVLALALLALLVLLARYLLRDPEPEPSLERAEGVRARVEPPTLAPRGAERAARVDVAEPVGGRIGWGVLPEGSPFQRRLALGARLLRLRERLQLGEVDAAGVLQVVRRRTLAGSLRLDAWVRGLSESSGAGSEGDIAAQLLAWLVEPRRDADALVLDASEDQDPILRVWTLGGPFPPADSSTGEMLLLRLRSVAGDRSHHGYDVVATANMGQELFPRSGLFRFGPPAAGVYAVQDELCLMRTVYSSAFQRILLKHELVHAWAIRQRGLWASRFLEEGLAEYLSRLQPGDARLSVPPRRFANEFAALLALVRRQRAHGFGIRGMSFQRLMSLDAVDFYGLGRMGYLLAQAAVAFAGGDAVEAAARQRTDGPLRSVIQTLTWEQLEPFLLEHGAGGRAEEAIVIEDLTPGPTTSTVSTMRILGRRRTRHALRATGVDAPAGLGDMALGDFLDLPVSLLPQDADRIARVLGGLRAERAGQVLLVSDATAAMGEPFQWSGQTLESLSTLVDEPADITTRAAFVEHLVTGLGRARAEHAPAVVAWHGVLESSSLPLPVMAGPVNTRDLLARLARLDEDASSLIVCLASLDGTREQMRNTLAESYRVPPAQVTPGQVTESLRNALSAYVRWMPRPPTRVLVIDLADGASDARLVAEVFAEALGQGAPVALWNPQQPVR